jgi:hypothetical protein
MEISPEGVIRKEKAPPESLWRSLFFSRQKLKSDVQIGQIRPL